MADVGREVGSGPARLCFAHESSLQILLVYLRVVSILDCAGRTKGLTMADKAASGWRERTEGASVALHCRSAQQRATLFQFIKLPTKLRTCKSAIPN